MQKITKKEEPFELSQWKCQNPSGRYNELEGIIKYAIRSACVSEQFGLCAFCCKRINPKKDSSHNAHLKSRHQFPQYSLEWDNIVASCNTLESCGKYQDKNCPPLSPLMEECESELQFSITGEVAGLTERADSAIGIFNLNNPALINSRKWAISCFLYLNEYYPPEEDLSSWDAEILEALMEECMTPDDNGNLAPYAPILKNIAMDMIKRKLPGEKA